MPPPNPFAPNFKAAVAAALNAMPSGKEFPFFDDGDVSISLAEGYKYRLHSSVLKNASAIMDYLLEEDCVSRVAANNGATVVYKLVLVENPYQLTDNGVAIEYVFEAVALDGHGRDARRASPNLRCGDEGYIVWYPQVIRAFDAVLRALYHEPINIGNAQKDDLSDLLSFALSVATVAEYLECTNITTQAIESTLLATGQELYRAISRNPVSWMDFAFRIKSKSIFKEALIHAAGQSYMPLVWDNLENMPKPVYNILANKSDVIKESVRKAEEVFVSFYPRMLMRVRKPGLNDRESISRSNYSNDILMWISLNIFRHWCGTQLVRDHSHRAVDMGWDFINTINTGGDAYLTQQELNDGFHARFEMSARGCLAVYHRLGEVKHAVKQWARPLLKNCSQLDETKYPVKYFLHTEVGEEDYPWVEQVDDDGDLSNRTEDVEDVRESIEVEHEDNVGEYEDDVGEYEDDVGEHGGNVGEYEDNVGETPLKLDNEVMDEIERLDSDAYTKAIRDMMEYDFYNNIDGVPMSDDDLDGVPMDEDIDGVPMDEDIDGVPMNEEMPSKGKQAVRDSDEEDQGFAVENLLALGRNEQDTCAGRALQDLSRASLSPTPGPSFSRGDTEPLEPPRSLVRQRFAARNTFD